MIWHEIPERICPTCKGGIRTVRLRCNYLGNFLVDYICDKCHNKLVQQFTMVELLDHAIRRDIELLLRAKTLPDDAEKANDNAFLRSMRIKV